MSNPIKPNLTVRSILQCQYVSMSPCPISIHFSHPLLVAVVKLTAGAMGQCRMKHRGARLSAGVGVLTLQEMTSTECFNRCLAEPCSIIHKDLYWAMCPACLNKILVEGTVFRSHKNLGNKDKRSQKKSKDEIFGPCRLGPVGPE